MDIKEQDDEINWNIHYMDMHEERLITPTLHVTRVPGGWLYLRWSRISSESHNTEQTFVPYTDEFEV